MPAKFLAGSRRPARSARFPARRISTQNVTSAHNYGIVKAGDGGNGGRGFDGPGVADTKDHAAIGSSTTGTSKGDAGSAGTVYSYSNIAMNHDSSTYVLASSAGKDGVNGNSGWNGLNFHYYYKKIENTKQRIWKDKFSGNYDKEFVLYSVKYYPHGSSTEEEFNVCAKIGNNGQVDRSINKIAFCSKGNGQTLYHDMHYDSNKALCNADNIYIYDYYTDYADTAWDLYYRIGSYLGFYVYGGIENGIPSSWNE